MNPLARTAKLSAIAIVAAAGALAPALAAPAAASASTRTPTIVLGGFTDHGYKVAVVLQRDWGNSATVEFYFMRREGRQYQVYSYGSENDAAFKIAHGARTATVKATFGETGEISLSLRFAARFERTGLPDQYAFDGPYVEKMRARTGVATGVLKFNSHSPFGTLRRTRLRAYLTYDSSSQAIADNSKLTMLVVHGSSIVHGSSNLLSNDLIGIRIPKLTIVDAEYSKDSTNAFPFELNAGVVETTPASIFTNDGLSSSKISVHGPFLTGTTSYHSTVICNKDITYGSQTGSIVAHFMIGGRQVYPEKSNLNAFTGLPAGVPNPFGTMLMNGPDIDSNCAGAGANGGSTSSAPTLTLP